MCMTLRPEINVTKKVLLLDTAFAAVPIHSWLVAKGMDVWTMGNRAYDPLVLAAPERWIEGNYGDANFVASVLSERLFDAVIPGCTDVSMDTFVRLNFHNFYKLSHETDQTLNNKQLFRKTCEELDLPAPRVFSPTSLPSSGKIICKPVDSFSGRGVSVFAANDVTASAVAIENARKHSPVGNIICEEFVEGELRSYSAFLKSGRVRVAFSVREGSRYDPFAVDTSYLADEIDAPERLELQKSVEKLARHLDLCDGLLHVQYICGNSRIAIVEATRRCPGDLYAMLIEYSTGFPFASNYAAAFVGEAVDECPPVRRWILRHTVKQTGSSTFNGLEFTDLENIFRIVPVRRLGEAMNPKILERTALVFMDYQDDNALKLAYERRLDARQNR